MYKIILGIWLVFGGLMASGFLTQKDSSYSMEIPQTVNETLQLLGDNSLPHPVREIEGASAEKGRDIVLGGVCEKPNGKQSKRQSRHFVCTSCHNIVKEDPDLSVQDPQARLEYAEEHGLPFLPGSTFHGMVNHTTFYSGDYQKKYGDLVNLAKNDIRKAIQVCAINCSQGRALSDWEIESILAYFWELQLQMSDLNLSNKEWLQIQNAIKGKGSKSDAIQLIKSKYLDHNPAHFLRPPDNRTEGNKLEGNAKNGKKIYDLSCLHCHAGGRYSFFNLDNTDYSFDFLNKHITRYTRYSIYQVIRWGTYPLNGKKAYMPNFTQEKMSRQQVEDLRAYIEERAK